ncbi:hypothetical protein [Niallia taxi]|uniref:hypothetical protein n=1 Tax=Niallia taxi TaxID=2499688 RepID=UPI0015F6D78F|nr:hypothetical protein [Niallia taxi]
MGIAYTEDNVEGIPLPRSRFKGKSVGDLPDFTLVVEPEGFFEHGLERLTPGKLRLYFERNGNKKYFNSIWGLDSYLTAIKRVVEQELSFNIDEFELEEPNYMMVRFSVDLEMTELNDVFEFADKVEMDILSKTHQELIKEAQEMRV